MYRLYKDKEECFECNISIEGADLSKAKARLVLENDEYTLLFDGEIDTNGKCTIGIKKLKFLPENLQGTLKLEVIVDDDNYFVPYEDKFTIETGTKVTAEVVESKHSKKTNTKVLVEVSEPRQESTLEEVTEATKPINESSKLPEALEETHRKLKRYGNRLCEHKERNTIVRETIAEVSKKYNLNTPDAYTVSMEVLEELKKSKKYLKVIDYYKNQ